MALSPLSPSSLNTKLCASPSLNLQSFLDMAEAKPSSPLKADPMTTPHAEDEINWDEGHSSPFVSEMIPEEGTARKLSNKRELTSTTLDFSPSKQLKMESASFEICEDDTSMPAQDEPTPRPSPAKKDSTANLATLEDALQIDDTSMANDDTEGIDDTCFSAFSEIPNMDMTRFARMGNNSPLKNSTIDQVRTLLSY
jgi:hypothetical protein